MESEKKLLKLLFFKKWLNYFCGGSLQDDIYVLRLRVSKFDYPTTACLSIFSFILPFNTLYLAVLARTSVKRKKERGKNERGILEFVA